MVFDFCATKNKSIADEDDRLIWMVGGTGFEPVTPTMSR